MWNGLRSIRASASVCENNIQYDTSLSSQARPDADTPVVNAENSVEEFEDVYGPLSLIPRQEFGLTTFNFGDVPSCGPVWPINDELSGEPVWHYLPPRASCVAQTNLDVSDFSIPLAYPSTSFCSAVPIGETKESDTRAGICQATTFSNHQVEAHETRCSWCYKEFERPADLRKHVQVHASAEDRKHRCDICDVPFLYAKDVDRHKAAVHPSDDGPKYFCHILTCPRVEGGKPFPRKDKLQEHLWKAHRLSAPTQATVSSTDDSPETCRSCGQVFVGKYKRGNLNRHQNHCCRGPKVLICTACPSEFKRADALKKHEWKKHRIGSGPQKRRLTKVVPS